MTKNSRIVHAVFLAAGLLVALPAKAEQRSGRDGEEWVPIKRLSFEEDDVPGRRSSPDGENVETLARVGHRSLIEIRRGFEAEIIKTMEEM